MRFLTALILCWLFVGGVVPLLVLGYCEIRDRRARKASAAAIDLDRVMDAIDAYRSTEPSPEAKVLTLPGCKPGVPTQRGPSGASSRFMLSDAEWELLRRETSHADGWES